MGTKQMQNTTSKLHICQIEDYREENALTGMHTIWLFTDTYTEMYIEYNLFVSCGARP